MNLIETSKFDTLQDQIVDLYGNNSIELNDTIKKVLQYYKIDWKNKDNVKPFLKLAILIKNNKL